MKSSNSITKIFSVTILFLFSANYISSQEVRDPKNTIRTGLGIGLNEGQNEIGTGIVTSIGWQRCFGEKNKIRINPNLLIGGFIPFGITDTRDQYYRITSLSLNIHYDILRYQSLSIVSTGGGFMNYSRGLLGTGGWPEADNNNSEYFYSIYFGGSVSLGLRIDPEASRMAYEIRPLNIQLGNKGFILSYLMIGIDIKI